jgi:formate dehydrogenase major subunit
MTGTIGKEGAGLMPLRGQNNVQGACDMGMLPYYEPDYQDAKEIGLMTPELVEGMLRGEIKALINMGEDITHIHPNTNKINKALKNLELIAVQEIFMSDIAKKADVVIGVRSAYEKTGVYVNAMRRLHLSQPLVKSFLPDDWEVLQLIAKKMGADYSYEDSSSLWDEVREVAHRRFSGASYMRLERHRKRGLQWPIYMEDTPRLHQLDFRTDDGLGIFCYHQYNLRGQVKEIVQNQKRNYYLTTGRVLPMYNNASQTKQSESLVDRYDEDILLICEDDKDDFSEKVVLKTPYGQTAPLRVKLSDKIKPKTLFCTFHYATSNINALFGDDSDELIKTPCFKSIKVEVVKQ